MDDDLFSAEDGPDKLLRFLPKSDAFVRADAEVCRLFRLAVRETGIGLWRIDKIEAENLFIISHVDSERDAIGVRGVNKFTIGQLDEFAGVNVSLALRISRASRHAAGQHDLEQEASQFAARSCHFKPRNTRRLKA